MLNIEFETEYMNSLMIGTFIIDVFPLLISLSGTKLLISDGELTWKYYWKIPSEKRKKSKEEYRISLSLSLSVISISVPIFISNYKISIILNMEIHGYNYKTQFNRDSSCILVFYLLLYIAKYAQFNLLI